MMELQLEGKFSRAIVLGADNGYLDQVETTIKSVSVHHDRVRFYVFNDDLPSEWFWVLNNRLKYIGSEVVNVKLSGNSLKQYHLPNDNLSYAAFFRYFIADYVVEDKVLYLDSDIVANGSLDSLFSLLLDDYPIAAVEDSWIDGLTGTFNSGVMLINVAYWRQENVAAQLVALTNQYHQEAYGDQGILNILFENRWKKLPSIYNQMVGLDVFAHLNGNGQWYENEEKPLIIHYTTHHKPWSHISTTRYRQLWWFYRSLEWSDILLRKDIVKREFKELITPPLYHTAIFTNSASLSHIEELLQRLKNTHFHILAYTNFAPEVINLERFGNVSIYPEFNPYNFKEVTQKIDYYLDINYENEIADIIQEMATLGKPVFAFADTSHDHLNRSFIAEVGNVDQMIQLIKEKGFGYE